jgi:hypothetical protein
MRLAARPRAMPIDEIDHDRRCRACCAKNAEVDQPARTHVFSIFILLMERLDPALMLIAPFAIVQIGVPAPISASSNRPVDPADIAPPTGSRKAQDGPYAPRAALGAPQARRPSCALLRGSLTQG